MANKQTISKISELSSNIKEITNNLFDEKSLSKSDILTITDALDEIKQTSLKIQNKSTNIFLKAGAKNICSDIKNLYGRIEEIEQNRQQKDGEILNKLYEISYKEDYLALNFFYLSPYDIEVILAFLDEEISEVSNQKPFNEKIINPLIEKVKNKFIELHFRYAFPIVEELDENNNSYAHRLTLLADEIKEKNPKKAQLLTNKIDELLDLVWLSKMFIYGDFERAQVVFEKINPKLKKQIMQIVWKVKGQHLNEIKQDNKWLIPAALMNYVSDVINA